MTKIESAIKNCPVELSLNLIKELFKKKLDIDE